ncbi:MAG: potassium transporter TrkG [Clostridia bacterium]
MASNKKRTPKLQTSTKIVLGFIGVIIIGAFLLTLPISSNSGQWTSPLTALFTATSATCVTGLVLVDTYTHWNFFGQSVILVMIQIGGLGFMTMATLFSFALRRKITFKERMMMSSALNVTEISGVVRLTKHILYGTFFFEGIGALVLATRFYKEFGLFGAIRRGVFLSISAFCNAGFDILGHETQFASLTNYATDFTINITIMALIILGGLGFFVWGDIYYRKRLSTHSKIVLISTAILVFSGTFLYLIFEFNNPATLGQMSFFDKLLAATFQSVTTRTAGFNTISQGDLTDPSMILTYVFMFIGGSPGSTAGGVKTVTIAILLLAAVNTVKGRTTYNFAGRSINVSVVLNAMSIFTIAVSFVMAGTLVITALEPIPIEFAIYEVISAFATVGLSAGVTPELSVISQIVLMVLMFFGRVGILTLGFTLFMGNKQNAKIKYPQGVIMIG